VFSACMLLCVCVKISDLEYNYLGLCKMHLVDLRDRLSGVNCVDA